MQKPNSFVSNGNADLKLRESIPFKSELDYTNNGSMPPAFKNNSFSNLINNGNQNNSNSNIKMHETPDIT
jgi:hypothetical protein